MKQRHLILFSFVLAIPLYLFLLRYYGGGAADLIPSGFTQDDNAVYIANARQHLEEGGITYRNPYSADPQAPAIYSQPQNYLIALLLRTGLEPGLIATGLGLVCALACIYLSLRILLHLYPRLEKKYTVSTLLVWGGGLTALTGLAASGTVVPRTDEFLSGIYLIDPGNGWWGLNFGRTLIIPVEALYHLLFLGGVYCLIRHRWVPALIVSFLICWAHPFTGTEYILIGGGWLFVEKILFRNPSVPWWFALSFGGVLLLHFGYYLLFLNAFPEHRKLFGVFSVDWGYSYLVYLPAYALVTGLAALTIYLQGKEAFAREHQRLFFAWALIAFLLSKHEWFIKPIQPLHFTRGYTWLGLFLFGLPGLIHLLRWLRPRPVLMAGFLLVFLADNALWYTDLLRSGARKEWVGQLSPDSRATLRWLQKNTQPDDLLLSNEYMLSYLSATYAPVTPWAGHLYNTPDYSEKRRRMHLYFQHTQPLPEWKGRRLLLLVHKQKGEVPVNGALMQRKLYENATYVIYGP